MNRKVSPGDWVQVSYRNAVVCEVISEHKIEIVYLDRGRPINEYAIYDGEKWIFEFSGPCGGYAINSNRLARFVKQLLAGEYC